MDEPTVTAKVWTLPQAAITESLEALEATMRKRTRAAMYPVKHDAQNPQAQTDDRHRQA